MIQIGNAAMVPGRMNGDGSQTHGELRIYSRGILTKLGQEPLEEFMAFLARKSNLINEVAKEAGTVAKKLEVWVGYHGSPGGSEFPEEGRIVKFFDQTERTMARKFFNNVFASENIRFTELYHEPTVPQIEAAIRRGYTFFAWCNSEARVSPLIPQIRLEDAWMR